MSNSRPATMFKSVLMIILFITLFLTGKAGADLGVGERVGGSLGSETTDTNVEMREEDVLIKLTPALREKADDVIIPEKLNGYFQMRVEAKFVLVNSGSEKEEVNTIFPMQVMGSISRGQTVKNLMVTVDGKKADADRVELDRQLGGFEGVIEKSKWASFDVSFDPGQRREVKVTYDSESGLVPKSYEYTDVGYVLETGADWRGPIKKGKITIEMPFQYSDQYVKLGSGGPWSREGQRLIWSFTNLEPTPDDNVDIQVRADTIRAYKKKPYFAKIEASSSKEPDPAPALVDGTFVEPDPDKIVRYFPYYAFDSDPETAWAVFMEGDPDPWIQIDFKDPKLIQGFDFLSGFKGPRSDVPSMKGPKTLELEFSDGTKRTVTLKDQDENQTVKIPTELTRFVKINIKSIYGDDQRVAISEITPNFTKPFTMSGKPKTFMDSDDFTLILYGIFTAGSLAALTLLVLLIRKWLGKA